MNDFEHLEAFISKPSVDHILEELRKVPFGFLGTWGNLTLPTEKDLPKSVPRRCAIVASGRSVLQEKAGQDIDAVDGLVMRMNGARTKNYEAFVGRRTDVLMINDQGPCKWMKEATGPPAEVKMVVVNSFGEKFRIEVQCMEYLQRRFPAVPVFLLNFEMTNNNLQRLMDRVLEKGPLSLRRLNSTTWSSSGLLGGLFLMNLCREVLHYGFIGSSKCRQHYWEGPFWDKHGRFCTKDFLHHDLTKEHVLWKVISNTTGVRHRGEGIVRGWPRLQSSAR